MADTRNIRLTLAYDGTAFHGWQTQPDQRSVQEDVEQVLRRIVREPIALRGASRTDAGVHARGQVANFKTSCDIPADNLFRAIAHHVPGDVALLHLDEVADGFHASRDATGKLYRYTIFASQIRPARDHVASACWHVWHSLDIDRMRAGAARLVGTHDFVSFATRGSPRDNTIRTIHRIEARRLFDTIEVEVEGDGFLYNQVRNIVGTLVEIARGHWTPERIDEILAARDRTKAGPTAPACGLCLEWVKYEAAALRVDRRPPP